SMVDSFTVAMTNLSMYSVVEGFQLGQWVDSDYMANFVQNGAYWKILAYTTAVGSCLMCFANPSGIALMKMEHIKVGWYIKNCTLKVLLGWVAGFAILWAEVCLLS
ncbi:MAG: sodium:proton antiporter, partial [Prevotella sp.]|nr:sodium:proton antiporter [Prevotella sp.]